METRESIFSGDNVGKRIIDLSHMWINEGSLGNLRSGSILGRHFNLLASRLHLHLMVFKLD